ncbi:MAG: ABC transporter ATP-binding protein [Hyphomicrobiales bacterium]
MRIFSFFENLIAATALPPEAPLPPRLLAFYWYFIRQIRGIVAWSFAAGFCVAVVDAAIPAFIGRIVTLVSTRGPASLLAQSWPEFLGMALVVLVARPGALLMQHMISNQTLAPGLGNLIRWQSHWHVVRQSWAFFQNDFAGGIANRVVQTGPSLRETLILAANAVWYIAIYGGSAILLMASNDLRLAGPIICWAIGYVLLLRYFVPRIRVRSRNVSAVRSALTGRVVDCYTNIVAVKLFSKHKNENDFIRVAIDEHTDSYRDHLRYTTKFGLTLAVLNGLMIVSAGALAVWLWTKGQIVVGAVAMTIPLTWQIANIAGWVAQQATALFENMGAVEDGMRQIAAPPPVSDKPDAPALRAARGHIEFENVRFGYGGSGEVLTGVKLSVAAGERVGLMGASGAGKSTLAHLLLRLYELDGGRILIDGQDIAAVTQESLRSQITLVTQDTSLLNRSIRDNIRLGRPDATEEEVREAASRARALEFIDGLEDWQGRKGLDAHIGDRGVKLSGGQRQRIAIARAILRNAPILVLDEATSALDNETESAIQGQLDELMKGRTVIAIAHRISTLAGMDRLVVLDKGSIVEAA